MKWVKKLKEKRNAHEDLYYVLSHNPATRHVDNSNIWQGVKKLSRSTAIDARKLISRNILNHTDIAMSVLGVLENYFDADTRMQIVLRNFDHAVALGWLYTPDTFRITLESIDEVRESRYSKDYTALTPEQESALLILGDSQWIKETTYGSCYKKRPYEYSEAVSAVTVQRPQDVAAIIKIAQSTEVTHAAHLVAVLDGEISSVLGDGAL